MSLRRLGLRLALPLVLLFAAAAARADTPITLWKAFEGRVNFTGTQATWRAKSNGNGKGNDTKACTIYTPDSVVKAALNLPTDATVVSAQLYWAGSGNIPDYSVAFEGADLTATRQYSSATDGTGYNYFGGAADVTDIVRKKGSGNYSFSGLTVANGNPWCASQAVLGGFSLLVVYSHPNQPDRILNLYEGFRHVQNGEVIVEASNFRWNRTAVAVEEKARVGHITWEGDGTLAAGGERLLFEGKEVSDDLNPEGNQFNSKSNINNDSASYGIDFDAYDTSVVLWSGYDAVVTTTYRTGQDLVLLNAEVLVVPTMTVADLSLAIARGAALKVGSTADYKLTVTNNGPSTEAGPVTVTSTLPAGMSFVSASGTNWGCTANGATGTCTYTGAIAPGTSAPVLAVKAKVETAGEKVVTATVKGSSDDNAANNTATDSATAAGDGGSGSVPGATANYAFTDSVCKAGVAIGADGQCKVYSAATVGGRSTRIYLTALAQGVPAAASTTADVSVPLQFGLECVNPASGTVRAAYAGADIPACPASGQATAWSQAVNLKFVKNAVSVEGFFVYNDVGQLRLGLNDNGKTAWTGEFVSAPLRIGFRSIRNAAGDANPGNTTPGSKGFAAAGAPLTLEVGAVLDGAGGYAPNFGNEKTPAQVVLGLAPIAGVALVSPGVLAETGTRSRAGGITTATASWSEVGATAFVAATADPDPADPAKTTGYYLGVQTPAGTEPVGRFYPAWFRTYASGPFACPASLPAVFTCPRSGDGAVYSRQPFKVTVEAYNANGVRLKNFTGAWFKAITLLAADSAGGALLATNFVPPAGAASTTIAAPTPVFDPVAGTTSDKAVGSAVYRLAAGYDNAQPRAAGVTSPTGVFVRAVSSDTNLAGDVVISSLRSGVVSEEQGVLVLNGRLKVPNALGTDILRTPLGLRAEYWAGAAAGWLPDPGYADPLGADGASTKIVSCSPDFADGKPCADAIGASAPQAVRLAKGAGVLWLRAPGKLANGRARGGSVSLQYDGWTWLPSTTGRVSFGSHRSPVIYVRELYF
jgi:uncharacterized repeat protein (TIGR01451 family)